MLLDQIHKKFYPDIHCSKQQKTNALKSIAALTSDFMGGLIGARYGMMPGITMASQNNLSVRNINKKPLLNNGINSCFKEMNKDNLLADVGNGSLTYSLLRPKVNFI